MNALPFIIAITDEGQTPKVVDTVNDNLMYVGYCTPDCAGYGDKKWLIKQIRTEGTIQTIFYANGSRQYNQAWSERANEAAITYKPTENFRFDE